MLQKHIKYFPFKINLLQNSCVQFKKQLYILSLLKRVSANKSVVHNISLFFVRCSLIIRDNLTTRKLNKMLQSKNIGLFGKIVHNKIAEWIIGYPITASYWYNPLILYSPNDEYFTRCRVEVANRTLRTDRLNLTFMSTVIKTE